MGLRLAVTAGALAIVGAVAIDRGLAAMRARQRREETIQRAVTTSLDLDAQADRLELEYNRVMAERERRYADLVKTIPDRAYRKCKQQCEWDLPVALARGRAWCATYLGGCREDTEKRLQADADRVYARYSERLKRIAEKKARIEAQLTRAQRGAIA